MSGLDNLKTRVSYRGGARQQDRMIEDKLMSLKKALIYSYQSASVGLRDEETGEYTREFRCLINPSKLDMNIDDKILSMPYEDIQLNAPKGETTLQGQVQTGIKVGDVVRWIDTLRGQDTYWLVYYQYLQERAYFRGMMRQCETEPVLIGGKAHYYYLKGPDDQDVDWIKTKNFIFNDLSYTVQMYISKTREANEFCQRFAKLEIKGKPFEIQAVDRLSSDNVLIVYLKEAHENKWAEVSTDEALPEAGATYIEGRAQVYPYDEVSYSIVGAQGGTWSVSGLARIVSSTDSTVDIEVTSGRSGSFDLIYSIGSSIVSKTIEILSL